MSGPTSDMTTGCTRSILADNGLATVDTELNESWLEFTVGGHSAGSHSVKIDLSTPDAPGVE